MEDVLLPLIICSILFIGLPWLVFHYVTKWKQSATITGADEKLLDELYDLARRLDDRLCSIERIMTAENPNWRQQCLPDATARIEEELSDVRSRPQPRPDRRIRRWPTSLQAEPDSIATSATARSWGSAPESPIIPAST